MRTKQSARSAPKVKPVTSDTKQSGPRTKNGFQAQVDRLKRAIRKKEDWERKIKNPVIRERYIEEGVAQGATREEMQAALEELDVYEGSSDGYDFKNIAVDHLIRHFDDLVPEDLRQTLEEQLDAIANLPEKDFHPGSDGKVQDLIHPSLFPFIRESKKQDEVEEEEEDTKPKKKKKKLLPTPRFGAKQTFGRPEETSKYQWLPSIFHISKDNKVTIRSYINNLDESEHPQLYTTISQVFENIYPALKKLLQQVEATLDDEEEEDYRQEITPEDLEVEAPDSIKKKKNKKAKKYHEEEEEEEEEAKDRMDEDRSNNNNNSDYNIGKKLANGELQVIVKACNYVLKKGQEYEGVWHVEGMSHEQIVASALYYYSSSPQLKDQGLAFRVENHYSHEYGPHGQPIWQQNTPLGAIRTNQGRVLMFSNKYQHKVTLLENPEKGVATRKILCFFVINPKLPIISTREVPPQQWERECRKNRRLLLLVAKRCRVKLPKDVVNLILSFTKWGYTMEEAKAHRLKLMEQRKFVVTHENQRLEREFSLCEH